MKPENFAMILIVLGFGCLYRYEQIKMEKIKTAFKILAARWFYYRELLLLKRHERSECHYPIIL